MSQVIDNKVVDNNYGQPTRQVIGGTVVERKRFEQPKPKKIVKTVKTLIKKVNAIVTKKSKKKDSKPSPKKTV